MVIFFVRSISFVMASIVLILDSTRAGRLLLFYYHDQRLDPSAKIPKHSFHLSKTLLIYIPHLIAFRATLSRARTQILPCEYILYIIVSSIVESLDRRGYKINNIMKKISVLPLKRLPIVFCVRLCDWNLDALVISPTAHQSDRDPCAATRRFSWALIRFQIV